MEAKEGKAGLDGTLNCLRITILVPLLSHGKLSKLVWYSTGTMNCNLKVQLIIDLRPVAGLVTYLPKQTWFWAGTVITGRHEAINNVGQVYSCNGSQEIITSLMLAISTQTGIAENSRVFFLMRNLIHLWINCGNPFTWFSEVCNLMIATIFKITLRLTKLTF